MMTAKEALASAVQAHQAGQWQQAEALYRQVLQAEPANADALHRLGVLAYQARQHQVALSYIGQALAIRPQDASFHWNRGVILHDLQRWDDAVACFREALRLRPANPEAHNHLGSALAKQGRLDEAVACFREALRLRPDNAVAYNNLGVALGRQGHAEEAMASFRQALQHKPNYAEAYYNLGSAFGKEGKLDETIHCYQQAVRLKPDFAEAHKDLGLTRLLLGNFEEGWQEYEWRWRCPDRPRRTFAQPRWDGSRLDGRTILLHAEQGLGDALQFVRYAPLVQQRGGKVLVLCEPSLFRLLTSCPGIDRVLTEETSLPDFHVHAPLLSLPSILGTTLDTIPASVPYVHPDPQRRRRWQQELQGVAAFNVGITWQGSPLHLRDRLRSVPLEQFAPLAQVAGVRLVRLQRGPGSEQLAQLACQWTVLDPLGWPEDPAEAWVETAALISALDLVITVDTAVAHLAGALAVPVWVALPFVPDWRWLLEREDCPWYPSMRLFRQQRQDEWPGVFSRIADALRQRQSDPTLRR